MRTAASFVSLVVVASISGCGSRAFNAGFPERLDPAFSEALESIASAPPREERSVVIAIAEGPRRLIAYDLAAGQQLFSVETNVEVAIAAGAFVVSREGDAIMIRRLADGEIAFQLDGREQQLVGADEAGGHLVVTVARGEGTNPTGVIYGAVDGQLAWMEELPLPVGVPAVAGPIVLVPWATQRLSMLDAETGSELARHRIEDSVIGHAFVHGGSVYLGQHGIFRVTHALADGHRANAAYYEPRGRPLPGQPPLLQDGYEPRLDAESARHRLRLVWAPAGEGEEVSFTDQRLYFVFYRMLFAMNADEDVLSWAELYDSDVVGAAVAPGGILVVSEQGAMTWHSAEDGRTGWTASLDSTIRVADVRLANDFHPEGTPGDAPPSLSAQLSEVAAVTDPRLGGGRALAVRYLAAFDDADVTLALIQLCANRADTGPTRGAACEAVAARTTGPAHVRDALGAQASFLSDTPAPPSGALARAAARMNLRITVPHLIRHLEDPATPEEELPGLIEALGEIGDARAVRPIESYLRRYHADSSDPVQVRSLGAAAEALLRLDEALAMRTLQPLIDDPLSPAPVRERLQAALVRPTAETEETPAATEAPPAPPTPPPADDRPVRITDELRDRIFAPADRRLRRCLEPSEGEPIASARLAVVLGRDGAVRAVHAAPNELTACMEPIVRSLTFPATQQGGQAIVYMVRRAP